MAFYIARRPPPAGVSNQTVSPPVATATASGPTPTLQLQVPPAAATASASSPIPVPQLRVSPAAATANASAPVPTVAADSKVLAPVATASASAPVPVPQLKVSPAAATASASAPTPVPALGIPVPVATASANSPPATPKLGVPPAAATASASSLVPVPKLQVNIPTKGAIVLGYSNQLLTGTQAQDAERLMGRTFRGLRQNQNITTSGWTTAISEYALGRKLTYRSVDITSGTWADVTAGTHDTELLAIASNLAAAGLWSPSNPAYICFMHEASISTNSVYGTGQDYINAYRHVVDLWDANGYTATKKDGTANGGPIVMVLVHFQRAFTNTLELGGTETPPAGLAHADFDPDGGSSPAPGGTTYYSGIGIDAYNSITSAGHLKYGTTASNLLDGVFTQAHNTGKFTFIGEFGCEDGTTTTDHTNKADWLDSVRAYLSSKVGTVEQTRALLLTIKSSAENYNVDSSQQSIDAFKRLGLHSDFFPEYATGFGNNSTLPISAPVATASASAPVPTIVVNQIVSPPAATASASSPVPVPQLRVLPPAAAASASAPTPTVTVTSLVSPPAATASASAPVPVPQLQVPAPAATASASAPLPTVTAGAINAPTATASASAPIPAVQLSVPPPAATASASAPVPVPQLRVLPPVATASASASVPTVGASVLPPAATASASAPVPTPQLRLFPPAATASASSPVPTVQDKVLPPAATASASAPVPTIQVRVIVPVGGANASAPVPTIDSGGNKLVSSPVATALGTAPVPTVSVGVKVSVPVATASASAPTPTVIMKQWPEHFSTQWPEHDYTRWPSVMSIQWTSVPDTQWPENSDEQW